MKHRLLSCGALDGFPRDSLTSSFTKLGLRRKMVSKTLPVPTEHGARSGGADVGKLLAGVLK